MTVVGIWQCVRAFRQADQLSVHIATLQTSRVDSAITIQTAERADIVQTLPGAPSVAQVLQTLQQAADKESARVISLQADDHGPTLTSLGHLDLVLSIKAQYPSILMVTQQVLDRYPGATLRQFNLAPTMAPTPTMPVVAGLPTGSAALTSTTEAEGRLTLAFWGRPLSVQTGLTSEPNATGLTSTSSRGPAATTAPIASATLLAPKVLPMPITSAASGTK